MRKIDYLRISVTDRCNMRCFYCMPAEGIETVPPSEVLSFEEILRLVKIFGELGIKRVRLTGGEPLVRKGIINLVKSISKIREIEEVSLTTNGLLLEHFAADLKSAGLRRINVSLDTLKADRFKMITGFDNLSMVLKGIEKAKEVGLLPVKLNTVLMKGINDDGIIDFLLYAGGNDLVLRFIEFMPVTPLWNKDYFLSIEEVKEICARNFKLTKIPLFGPGPAEYYQWEDLVVGFIKTSRDNCCSCNRLRLTS
ncbi:MAG: GTP 3',8-cyclase MoaA, partial [Candidatus Omnitrophota bacterium]